MKRQKLLVVMLVGLLTLAFFAQSYAACENKLLNIMKEELDYNFTALHHADSAELYFMALLVISLFVEFRYVLTCLLKEEETAVRAVAQLSILSNALSSIALAVPSLNHFTSVPW